MGRMIYLDNAATTWPKSSFVLKAMTDAMKNSGGNPGRGSHRLALSAAETVYDCRCAASVLFNAKPENVVFTLNATSALNMAIKGLCGEGDHILIDNYAHNAAYRPVMGLVNTARCTMSFYDASGDTDSIIDDIEEKIRPETRLLIATHQSNICSRVLPIIEIGNICKKHGIMFVVDASQSAGHIPIDIVKSNISALCVPGHKGLWGPMGVGMLISGDGTEFKTIIEGGAGVQSIDIGMPEELPERLEPGTVPFAAIAGLLAGIRWVRDIGIDEILEHEHMLGAMFLDEAEQMSHLKLYGDSVGTVIGFGLRGRTPAEVGSFLASRGICVRTGYHCAPIAHKTVGSYAEGSVRVSFSYKNKPADVIALTDALWDLEN